MRSSLVTNFAELELLCNEAILTDYNEGGSPGVCET